MGCYSYHNVISTWGDWEVKKGRLSLIFSFFWACTAYRQGRCYVHDDVYLLVCSWESPLSSSGCSCFYGIMGFSGNYNNSISLATTNVALVNWIERRNSTPLSESIRGFTFFFFLVVFPVYSLSRSLHYPPFLLVSSPCLNPFLFLEYKTAIFNLTSS